uniref:NF-kappa-B essential modulator n=1 Tax=Callorhinchus milii TaxID=7868 RepID=V9KNM2_CALMI
MSVSRCRVSAMVHPDGSLGHELQADPTGREAATTPGAPHGPDPSHVPDLSSLENSNRELHRENVSLRNAIRQSNQALKERYDELLAFRDRNRQEKEFLMEKFTEARRTVGRLSQDNTELRRRLETVAQGVDRQTAAPGLRAPGEGEVNSSDSPPSSYATLTQSLLDCTAEEGVQTPAGRMGAPQAEGTEFLLLLKGRKEELEEDVRRLREAEEQCQREKRDLVALNSELQLRVGPGGQEQSKGGQELMDTIPASRALELEERVEGLQRLLAESEECVRRLRAREGELQTQSSAQDKQRLTIIRQLEQMAEDKGALKSQVTSLVGELQESQISLEATRKQNTILEERYRTAEERLRSDQQEAVELKKKHLVQVDELRITAQSFESALKTERQNASEGRRKLAQLQAAYHQLFIDYDGLGKQMSSYKTLQRELEELRVQVQEAEEALVLKQELIDKLKEQAETCRIELETIPVLTAQANVFKDDFLAERAAREQLHEQKERLQEQLNALSMEHEDATRAHIEDLQRRHNDSLRAPLSVAGNYYGGGNTVPFNQPAVVPRRRSLPDEEPEFRCPKCQYLAPDIDTLQIHVMDCIQ